jgi:hypothetical protein
MVEFWLVILTFILEDDPMMQTRMCLPEKLPTGCVMGKIEVENASENYFIRTRGDFVN